MGIEPATCCLRNSRDLPPGTENQPENRIKGVTPNRQYGRQKTGLLDRLMGRLSASGPQIFRPRKMLMLP